MAFRRLLFRATRGKVLVYFKNSDVKVNNEQNELVNRTVYILVFQEGMHFLDKVQKICDSFNGKRY